MLRAAPLALLLACPAAGGVAVQLSGGAAHNAPSPLLIRQDGETVLDRNARLDTRSFDPPLYYTARAGRWDGPRAWELELVHHKVYLEDAPPGVEFAVSHGLNFLLLNRARREGGWLWRGGLGPVIAHPETKIRGRTLKGGGYYLSGAAAQLSLERRLTIWNLFLSLEAKATLAWARVPVAGGHASLLNPAFHALVGVGCEL